MFLDGGEPIDPAVVGVRLVVGGDQTLGFIVTQVHERDQAHMPIEQQVLAGTLIRRSNGQGFDQPDILDGGANLLELDRRDEAGGCLA